MQVCIGTSELSLYATDRESEWHGILDSCEGKRIVLGTDAQGSIRYHVITIVEGGNRSSKWGIGIRSERHGIEPSILPRPEDDSVWVGYNREVVCLSLRKTGAELRLGLDSLFHQFIAIRDAPTIILCEAGVVALDTDGKLVWRRDTDLIQRWSLHGEFLYLQFADDLPIQLAVRTGQSVTNPNG